MFLNHFDFEPDVIDDDRNDVCRQRVIQEVHQPSRIFNVLHLSRFVAASKSEFRCDRSGVTWIKSRRMDVRKRSFVSIRSIRHNDRSYRFGHHTETDKMTGLDAKSLSWVNGISDWENWSERTMSVFECTDKLKMQNKFECIQINATWPKNDEHRESAKGFCAQWMNHKRLIKWRCEREPIKTNGTTVWRFLD